MNSPTDESQRSAVDPLNQPFFSDEWQDLQPQLPPAVARQRGIAVMLASLLVLIGSIFYIGHARSVPPALPDYEGTGTSQVELVQIPAGSSISELGKELVSRDIVKSNAAFQKAAGENPAAAQVEPGYFRLHKQMSAAAAVAALLDPANKVELLKIPGGNTLEDVRVVGGDVRYGIFSSISQLTCAEGTTGCVSVDQLRAVAATADPVALGVPTWALDSVIARTGDPRRLEGLIVPGEYVINPGANATEILTELLTESASAYTSTDIVGRAAAVGMTPYELLIAASLVEREAPAGDFDKVARVILNRLAEQMPLQFDSTVNYDLPDQEIATTDADRARETPWNTYVIPGLPATPIASPSMTAITAMENPAEGPWLYFVTTDLAGTTVFSTTFDEHQAATQQSIDNGVLDSQR